MNNQKMMLKVLIITFLAVIIMGVVWMVFSEIQNQKDSDGYLTNATWDCWRECNDYIYELKTTENST